MFFIFILAQKLPQWIDLYKKQGELIEPSVAVLLNGQRIDLAENKKRLIVFWATWCGPCRIELARINRLINQQKIQANDVLAISSYEDKTTVQKFVAEAGYQFQVALDEEGQLAKKYNISGTPTLILVNDNNVVEWSTTGLSPTLELRIQNFFN